MRLASMCICCFSTMLDSNPAVLMPFLTHRIFGWKPTIIDESWGLRTITSGVTYQPCHTLSCGNCHTKFLDVRFDDVEMDALYKGYRDKEYTETRALYEPDYPERNKALMAGIDYMSEVEAFIKPFTPAEPVIVDYGGDTGKNTPFANRRLGHYIYDINKTELVAGAARVTYTNIRHTKFDLMVYSNVLEHVANPFKELDAVRYVLGDAILYIEVPHEESMQHGNINLPKRHWHEHINFFTEVGLRILLTQHVGLRILALKKTEKHFHIIARKPTGRKSL